MEITIENFTGYIGSEIILEICCYAAGIMYPERNILVGMNEKCAYFKSIEEDEEDNQYWHFHFPTDKSYSMVIYSIN